MQLGRVVDGGLCGSCQREFAFRGEIRGWAVTRYLPALADANGGRRG
jgi:hypothetical protein